MKKTLLSCAAIFVVFVTCLGIASVTRSPRGAVSTYRGDSSRHAETAIEQDNLDSDAIDANFLRAEIERFELASAKAQADWEIANRNLFEEANAKYLAALSAYNAIVESRTAEHTAALDAYCSEMVAYEQSKALFAFRKREYDAALELALARDYLEQSRSKESRGLRTEAQRTLDIAHQRLRVIVKKYSATPAADDAKAMLAGKLVEPRKIPALLVRPSEPKEPPALVLPNAPERFLVQELPPIAHQPGSHGYAYSRSTEYPTPVLIGGGRTVFVKGYFRKDGKYVHSHTRSAPGTKTRR